MSNSNLRLCSAAILTVAFCSCPAVAQTVPADAGGASAKPWHSDSAVYIAGLDNLKQNSLGSLRITSDGLVFSTHDAHEHIPLQQITSVYIGDERVATGGTSAKVARKIFLLGFGAAAGALTSKTVDVLTIEYQDGQSGYHGVVFEVPRSQAEIARQQLATFSSSPHQETSAPGCNDNAHSKSLLLAAIDEQGVQLPSEYRVLLYEQLVSELRKSYAGGTVLRVGDPAAGCPTETLHVSVGAFKKGNEKLRSSTGPVGLLVGGTSVGFTARLVDQDGTVVFEKKLKNSKHGDSDSLGVARNVAESVSKHLSKAKALNFETAD